VRSGVAQTVRALLGFALSFALAVSAHAKETVIERFFNEDGERVVVKATETFLRHSGAKAFAVRYSERYAGGKGPAPVGNRDGTNETDDDGSFELNFDEHWSGGRAFAISVAGAMCPKGAASCSSGVTIHLFDDPSTAKSRSRMSSTESPTILPCSRALPARSTRSSRRRRASSATMPTCSIRITSKRLPAVSSC
jgi:hypothetical protein